jgi:PhoH-like ATPase
LEQDHGYLSLSIPDKQKETLFSKGSLELVALDEEKDRLIPNLFLDLGEDQLAKVSPSGDCIIALRPRNPSETWGISARNREQHFAIEALMDPQIPLVTLYGPAGTGKTLLAVAIGLVHVLDERKFKKMTVTKPVIPMGKDIGYLPGSMDEKIRPWVQPIYDNLEFLFGNKGINAEEYLAKRHLLEVQVLSHIRGRSIPEQYLIIDEAQNLTPHEIKTILTRVGEKTKIILTGDPHQIDHPYLDTMSNGLMYAKSKFYGDSLAAHIHLVHGERSALSSRAAQLL